MEVDDVLANKMVELGVSTWLPIAIEILTGAVAEILVAGNVPDGCIKPDIKIFLGVTRNLEAKVGRVARYVPILQTSINPLTKLVRDCLLYTSDAADES